VRDHRQDLGDIHIAAITFAEPQDLAPHRAHLDLPFPLLADPDRQVYRQFDLRRGALLEIWNPGTLRLYVDLLRRGRSLRRPTQDTRQLGGDFVLDAEGRLVAGFWPTSPDARPGVDSLVDAVAQAHRDR
jgi:hypothetical protein